jgi:hypothetical protein
MERRTKRRLGAGTSSRVVIRVMPLYISFGQFDVNLHDKSFYQLSRTYRRAGEQAQYYDEMIG